MPIRLHDILRMFYAVCFLISFRFIDQWNLFNCPPNKFFCGDQPTSCLASCLVVLFYWLSLTIIFFFRIFAIRKTAKEFFLESHLRPDSRIKATLEGHIFNILIAGILSGVIAAATLIFIYTVDGYYLTTIFMDMFVFLAIYRMTAPPIDQEFNPRANIITHEFITNIMNIAILAIMLISLTFISTPAKKQFADPAIMVQVQDEECHACRVFKAVARIETFFDLNVQGLRVPSLEKDSTQEELGMMITIIIMLIKIMSISLFPLTGITMLFKSTLHDHIHLPSRRKINDSN